MHSSRGACPDPASGGSGERSLYRLTVRQLTVTLAAACHAARRMHKVKLAANVLAFGIDEIGDDAACVMRDEVRTNVPILPASKAPTRSPTLPQGSEGIVGGGVGNLEVGTGINAAIAQCGVHGPI